MARRATAVKQELEKDPNALLLDAGNALFGQTLADNTNGRVVIAAMNQLQYDAMAIGIRDLDQGTKTLYDRAKDAQFPLLSANVIDPETNQTIGKPYEIVTVGGKKIALIGLTTLAQEIYPPNQLNLTEKDPITTAREVIDQVKQETNVVIVLSNLGDQQEKELAEQVSGITVIVGGGIGPNKPAVTTIGPNGTVWLRAQINGEELGAWQMTINTDGQATNVQGQLITLLADGFAEDAAMRQLLDGFQNATPLPSAPTPGGGGSE